ncbi:NhaP-type Na+/H+ or K+/H+ antiporter [Elusimicrobium simillimum]|uniref:cation:proton antiporter domain-containing protein n=1 Tax=Elusimicrobium simillimum TaxID=3143438 RepID=UPI003C704FA3
MAINITFSIFFIGLILILGQVFSATFQRTRVPDILPLMLLGFLLGPTLKLVNPDTFGQMGHVFTEIVLILVMFQTGAAFRLSYLRDSFLPGLFFAVAYILLVVIVITILTMKMLGLPMLYAVTLGFILADNSLVIIMPMIAKFNITQNLKTILTVENAMGSMINVIVVLALLSMVSQQKLATHIIAGEILYTFLMAALVGLISGIFWTAVLDKVRMLENSMVLTFAFILIVYSVSAAVGSKGAIGVLMLGIVMGNIRVLQRFWSKRIDLKAESFKGTERNFFSEIEFAFKTLFFVYMGMSLYIQNKYLIICGVILALVKYIIRIPVVNHLLSKNINRHDAAVAFAMVPNGLVSAVLAATMAQQYGASKGIEDLVYSVIFFTVIFSSVLSFFIEKGWFGKVGNVLFYRHAPYVPKEEAPAEEHPQETPPQREQQQCN